MDCTWCGKPATQIVVYEGKVRWQRCEEHKLSTSLKAEPGQVLTDEEMVVYWVHEI